MSAHQPRTIPPKPEMIRSERFGPYSLVAKIGQGGMGSVFLGAKRGLRDFTKLVVVKRLHERFAIDAVTVEMFLDEARLAARLSNPHVVQTYEVGEVDGAPYLTMEYLEGQPLSRLLRAMSKAGQVMPLSIAVRIFSDVLEGLQHAHTLRDFDGTPLNVIHRDISPGNIFLTYDGHAKLLDFGVARARTHVHQTLAGVVKGKLAYLAPEVARSQTYDHRADLWGIGIVMWEALAGERLFKAESDAATLGNVLHSEIRSLNTPTPDQRATVPERLGEIVDRALARDPAERYASAAEMREELEAFAHDEGLRTSRTEVGEFVSDFFDRERDELRRILRAHMARELQRSSGDFALGSSEAAVAAESAMSRPVQGPRATGAFSSLLSPQPSSAPAKSVAPIAFAKTVAPGDLAGGDVVDPARGPVGSVMVPSSPNAGKAPSRGVLAVVFALAIGGGVAFAWFVPGDATVEAPVSEPVDETPNAEPSDAVPADEVPADEVPADESTPTVDTPIAIEEMPAEGAPPNPSSDATDRPDDRRPAPVQRRRSNQRGDPPATARSDVDDTESSAMVVTMQPDPVADPVAPPPTMESAPPSTPMTQVATPQPTTMRPTTMRRVTMRPVTMRPAAMDPEVDDFLTF